jgi:hypothetical protein
MIRIGSDLGLFKALAAHDGPASVEKLAEPTGADPLLLRRILRYLASNRLVVEISKDQFAGNKTTRALADPRIEGGLYHASVIYTSLLLDTYKMVTNVSKVPH